MLVPSADATHDHPHQPPAIPTQPFPLLIALERLLIAAYKVRQEPDPNSPLADVNISGYGGELMSKLKAESLVEICFGWLNAVSS